MKLISWQKMRNILAAVVAILLTSPVFALGLGNTEVRSYLNQPLLIRIPLISQSGEELGTVTAGMASAADLEMMGLNRTVSVPLHFNVVNEAGNAYVEVSSRLAITDPVIQLVVEVRWSGGRMLREYTLFLDPPTIAVKPPRPVVSSQPISQISAPADKPPGESYPDPSLQDVVETIKPQAEPVATVPDIPAAREPVSEPFVADPIQAEIEIAQEPETPLVSDPPVETERRQTATVPADPVIPEKTELESTLVDEVPESDLQIEALVDTEVDVTSDELVELVAEPVVEIDDEAATEVQNEPVVEVIEEAVAEAQDEPAVEVADEAIAEVQDELAIEVADEAVTEAQEEPAVEVIEEAVAAVQDEPAVEVIEEAVAEIQDEPVAQIARETIEQVPAPAEPVIDEATNTAETSYQAGDEIIGPIQSGETLWAIATRYNRDTSYSINQAMLAIQRLNPEAFSGNNINSLRRGAILRMPAMNEIGRLNKRQAMLEAIRQEQAYAAMRAGQPYESLPVISDQGLEQIASTGPDEADFAAENSSSPENRLQLVPPSQPEDQAAGGSGSSGVAVGAVSSQDVEEVLSRTEEELANAQQENAYLNERIQELEAQISAQQADGLIVDSDLAEMEQNLRENRLSDEPASDEPKASQTEDMPWYLANAWWAGGLLLVLISAVVWFLRRLGGSDDIGPDAGETAKIMRSEAEDILKTLDEPDPEPDPEPDTEPVSDNADNVIDLENYAEPVTTASEKSEIPVKDGKKAKIIPIGEEEAIELDADDPEVKLDLARAYLSMGDKDAARKMLEEVIESGDEAQVSEAKEMMNEL